MPGHRTVLRQAVVDTLCSARAMARSLSTPMHITIEANQSVRFFEHTLRNLQSFLRESNGYKVHDSKDLRLLNPSKHHLKHEREIGT